MALTFQDSDSNTVWNQLDTPQVITIGTGLELVNNTISATGSTGTFSAGSQVITVVNGVITTIA